MSYIPKVGEECLFQGNKVLVTAVGEETVLAKNPSFVNEIAIPIKDTKPIKTPAEIERENSINKALEVLGHDYSDDSVLKMLGALHDAGILGKQQVKPLSRSYATGELRISDGFYNTLVDLGFIVQGGE